MNYRERGEKDIYVAKMLMSEKGNPSNDEGVYDIAAYHVQQAIEKEIKYVLHDVQGEDDTTRKFRTHNIADLIGQLEKSGVNVPEELVELAYDVSNWEASARYGGDVVASKEDINNAIDVYENFVSYVKDNIDVDGIEEEVDWDPIE